MKGDASDIGLVGIAAVVTVSNILSADDTMSAMVGWSCGFFFGVALAVLLAKKWTSEKKGDGTCHGH